MGKKSKKTAKSEPKKSKDGQSVKKAKAGNESKPGKVAKNKAAKDKVAKVKAAKVVKAPKSAKSEQSGVDGPKYKNASASAQTTSATELFRLQPGLVDLREISTVGPNSVFESAGPQSKEEAVSMLADLGETMRVLQEKLFAESMAGKNRAVLVVLQGMDTAGKDGVIDKVIGQLNPGAVRLASFKRPNAEELGHDFLWRIEKQVPAAGLIGVFNRSHYEDVLIQRVHNIVPEEVWSQRYAAINEFEQRLAAQGVTIVKCFLHIGKETQRERLAARLDDPLKHWKFNPADIDERAYWNDYQIAYTAALAKCSTPEAPWHVIPSDRKWYRNWAIGALIAQTLIDLDPQYPAADFDVQEQRRRLANS